MRDSDKVFIIPYANFSQSQFTNTFADGANPYLASSGVVGVPVLIDPLVMYWNRDMLKTAGIAEPTPDWTLDQMVEAAKKVQQSKSWPEEFYPVGYTWGVFR